MCAAKRTPPRHLPLLGLFVNEYEAMRQKMDAEAQPALLDIAPLVFSKWFYTSLAADTILSPANIIGKDMERPGNLLEHAYILRTNPDAQGPEQYTFTLHEYSFASHPLVYDLKELVEFCRPDCETDAGGFLLPRAQEALLPRLSLGSRFYLEYLTRLAWMQGLLVPMPAIHTHRVQPSADCEAFFLQSTAGILEQLGETACALAAERFCSTMNLEDDIATPDFFRSCLEKHTDVDQVFVEFYKRVDVDIMEIWQTPPPDLTEDEHSILSSFLFTGIMLDKWFLMPMSAFFRFIRPLAFVPMRFFPLVNHLAALTLMQRNLGSELFAPPAYYSLTLLGETLFAAQDGPGEDRQEMPDALPYKHVLGAVKQAADARLQERQAMLKPAPKIVSIKVSLMQDADVWKMVETGVNISLHEFCLDLSTAFGIENEGAYLLSVPDSNGYPREYSPAWSKRSVNKTDGLFLRDLPLAAGKRLRLSLSSAATLLLDITTTGEGSPYLIYPRICRQSQKVIEQEREDETF